jgi:hypothetical protein
MKKIKDAKNIEYLFLIMPLKITSNLYFANTVVSKIMKENNPTIGCIENKIILKNTTYLYRCRNKKPIIRTTKQSAIVPKFDS